MAEWRVDGGALCAIGEESAFSAHRSFVYLQLRRLCPLGGGKGEGRMLVYTWAEQLCMSQPGGGGGGGQFSLGPAELRLPPTRVHSTPRINTLAPIICPQSFEQL